MNMFRTRCMLFYFAKNIKFVSWGNTFPSYLHLFLRTFQQPNPFCCTRSTTNLLMISFLSRTLYCFSFFLSIWIYLWPYELRICDRCDDWHTIQDEEHILLDCPHEHLVRLRTQQQLIFPPQFEDGPACLRTFMNQPDIFGVASFVAKCLALFPWIF